MNPVEDSRPALGIALNTGEVCFSATRRLWAALLTSSALALAWMLPATGPARAQDATWQTNPGSGDFFDANNWAPGSVPTGTASFGASSRTTLTLGSSGIFGGWTFNAGTSNYTFNVAAMTSQDFTGAGITINGGGAAILNSGLLVFNNASTAGGAGVLNKHLLIAAAGHELHHLALIVAERRA